MELGCWAYGNCWQSQAERRHELLLRNKIYVYVIARNWAKSVKNLYIIDVENIGYLRRILNFSYLNNTSSISFYLFFVTQLITIKKTDAI